MPAKLYISVYIVGRSNCGKSSLIRLLTQNAFSPDYNSSCRGMGEPTTTVFTDDGVEVCVSFLKREEGDDDYAPRSLTLYKTYDSFIVLYDVSEQSSLQNVQNHCQAIKMYHYVTDGIILVGNKCDKESAINPVDVKRFARNEDIDHIEISVKENINVEEMLMKLLSRRLGKPCTRKWQSTSISPPHGMNSSLQIQTEKTERGTEHSQSLPTSDSKKQNSSLQSQTLTTTGICTEPCISLSISESEKQNSSIQPQTLTRTRRGTEQSQSLLTSNFKKQNSPIKSQSLNTTRKSTKQCQSLSIAESVKQNLSHQNVTAAERRSCCVII